MFHIVDRGFGNDPMTQIEYVARPVVDSVEQRARLLGDGCAIGAQNNRIEIALHGGAPQLIPGRH